MAEDKFDRRQANSSEFIKNETNPVPLRLVGPYSKVPNWKCVDFWMGGTDGTSAVGNSKTKRTNWRKNNYGAIDFTGNNAVNENVLLIPDGMSLEVAGGIKLAEVSESIGKGDDLLSIIAEAAAIATSSMSVPQWKPKVLDGGLKPLQLPQSFKFNFHYGAAGLYDAFEEVVKPVYALVGFFGVPGGGMSNATISTGLPYPTKGVFIFNKIKGAVDGLLEYSKNSSSSSSDEKPMGFDKIADVNSRLQSALARGAAGIALSEKYHNLYISWGRFTLGPFQYTDIKYSFDMSQFDSNGWPLNGTFEVGGLESMRVSSSSAMASPVIIGA